MHLSVFGKYVAALVIERPSIQSSEGHAVLLSPVSIGQRREVLALLTAFPS